jgi:hypothetical protein
MPSREQANAVDEVRVAGKPAGVAAPLAGMEAWNPISASGLWLVTRRSGKIRLMAVFMGERL